MRRFTLSALMTLPLALSAPLAQAQNLFQPGIYDMARAMNCQSWDLKTTGQAAPMYAPIPEWIVFNEGPAEVVVKGGNGVSQNIEVFSGKVARVLGDQGVSYTIGLAGAGSARVHVCRV